VNLPGIAVDRRVYPASSTATSAFAASHEAMCPTKLAYQDMKTNHTTDSRHQITDGIRQIGQTLIMIRLNFTWNEASSVKKSVHCCRHPRYSAGRSRAIEPRHKFVHLPISE
jgi:hypothetical protein